MGFFKRCLFSPIEGTVLLNGKPVENVKVIKEYDWANKNKEGKEITRTNSDGYFSFPALYDRSVFTSLMPHEPLVLQYIMFEHNGNEYLGWRYSKGNYEEGGELGKSPIKLVCDLSWEKKRHNVDEPLRRYRGTCIEADKET